MLEKPLLDRLEDSERKFAELEGRLSEPSVLANPREYARIARERAALEELVGRARQWRRLVAEMEGHRSLLQDPDQDVRELARSELREMRERQRELEQELRTLLVPPDPNDRRNVVLEIRAGTGGEEACLFAAELFRMYVRYAESRGWKVEILSSNPTGLKGYKEIIALIEGPGAYSRLKYEGGVHRVQRVPVTEAAGRIHTSAVTVAVLPEAEEVDVQLDERDLRIDVFRSSGPGGQSVNTTDSAVRVTHLPTGLMVTCQDEKSQHKNKAKALKILRARLLERAREEQHQEIAESRRNMVRSGDRSEKIRTYNFPQNRVTDHRAGLTLHNLGRLLDGELDPLIEGIAAQAAR